MNKQSNFILILIFLFLSGLYAEDSTNIKPDISNVETSFLADRFSLSNLIELAYELNPELKSAKLSWEANIERLPQAGALPDPMFKAGYFMENVETRVGPQEHRYMLTQEFPYPGTLKARENLITLDSEILREKFEKSLRDLIVNIKINYFELIYLNESIRITEENSKILIQILKIASTQYADNKATLNDVLKAESQLAQLEYDVITLKELKEVIKGKLISLTGLNYETKLGDPVDLPLNIINLDLNNLYKIALSKKQEIRLADLKVKKMQKKTELVDKMNKPMFSLGFTYIQTGEAAMAVADSGKDPMLVELGFSIPLWPKKNRSKIVESKLESNAALEDKIDIQNKTTSSIRETYFQLENSKRLIELYGKTLIPQAAKSMELAQDFNKSDLIGLSDFLEIQTIWFNFNLSYQRAIADYRQHTARLEKIVGGNL